MILTLIKKPGTLAAIWLLVAAAGLTPVALAQVPDLRPVIRDVDAVQRQAERAAEQARRQAERAAESARQQAQERLQDRTRNQLRAPELPAVALDKLPARLPIGTDPAKPLFVEVEVEHGWRAIEREWLVMATADEAAALAAVDAEILGQKNLPSLGLSLIRFRVAAKDDSLSRLRALLPEGLAEKLGRNHVYLTQSGRDEPTAADTEAVSAAACHSPVRIGMIDTLIQQDHPAFSHTTLSQKNFLPSSDIKQPDAHGTAVAGVLVGQQDELTPLLPDARLYNAAIFYTHTVFSEGATLLAMVEAIDWLVGEQVMVINLSLTGPANPILEIAIEQAAARNVAMVAAAGNQGPAAPVLYPAGYPEVIAVTAVDEQHAIYRWANQGAHLDFAAAGVSVLTARHGGVLGKETGTSIAAPVVTALLACVMADQPDNSWQQSRDALLQQVIDLGDSGHDPVFGHGLLQPPAPKI